MVLHPARVIIQMLERLTVGSNIQFPLMEGTMGLATSPSGLDFDLKQFTQWMLESQNQLLREIIHHQRESQASLVWDLQKIWVNPCPNPASPLFPMKKPTWAP